MNRNQLKLEDILKEEDIVNDMKKNNSSQFFSIVSDEVIRSLIDYSTKMPKTNDFDTGFKFPYFACEILSCESEVILERFLSKTEIELENPNEDDCDESNESEEDDEEEIEENNDNEVSDRENNKMNIDDGGNNDDGDNDNEEVKEEQMNEETNVIKEEAKPEVAKEKREDEVSIKDKESLHQENQEQDKENELEDDSKKEEDNKIEIQKEEPTLSSIQEEKNILESKNEDKQIEDEDTNLDNSKEEEEEKGKNHQKNKRKNKERQYKTVYPSLDHFFEFLNIPPSESNYVLIGYFNKILCSLIDKRGDIIINYLFDLRPEILDSLLKHLNRRLIGECVCRILSYSSDSSLTSLNDKKLQLLEKIIQELNETNDDDTYEFICNALINTISNKQLFQLLMSKNNLIDLLYSILFSNQKCERNLQSLLALMIKINELIIKAMNGPDKSSEGIMEQLSNYFDNNMNSFDERKYLLGDTEEENEKNVLLALKHLFDILKESNMIYFEDLSKFTNPDEEFATSYEGKQKLLGTYKLYQVEFFKTIMDIIIDAKGKKYYESDIEILVTMIKDSGVFRHLIEFFFSFEFNNVYQNIFGQIMSLVLNLNCPSAVIHHIFKEEKLIEKMMSHLITDRLFSFSSNRTINSCLFAFEINFLSEAYSAQNVHIDEIVNANKEFQKFYELYLKDLSGLFKGKLCYSEEGNALSSQSNNSPIEKKEIYQSLNKTIEENITIYNVYLSNGEYKTLLNEKARRIDKMRKERENESINVNIFDRKSNDDDDNGTYISSNDNINVNEIESEIKNMIRPEPEENYYYDNNYWNLQEEKSNIISDDLLNDLLQ